MKQRSAWVALSLASWLSAAALAADHSHLNVVFELGAEDIAAKGDALGVYAVEVIPCAVGAASERRSAASAVSVGEAPVTRFNVVQGARWVIEGALTALSGTAHANHRERFDGPSSREFLQPVALDQASRVAMGELLAAIGQYCHVRVTLARLPSTPTRPAQPFGLRLSGRSGAELKIDFRETLVMALRQPWRATGQSAELAIRLRPRGAAALIPDDMDDFGVISQRVIQKLALDASAEIRSR